MWYRTAGCMIMLTLSLLAAPRTAEVQTSLPVYRIGVLWGSTPTPALLRRQDALRQVLRDLGYVEGQNLAIEYRYADGKVERLPDLAAELVRLNLDVLVASGSEGVAAAKHATQTIPIVVVQVGDPVQRGFVDSLARPGGNITGVSNVFDDVIGKHLELLKEVVPQLARVAVLWNPPQAAHAPILKNLQDIARTVGVELHPLRCTALRTSRERSPPCTPGRPKPS
jgi:putative ABC transport system substrate-binding protein